MSPFRRFRADFGQVANLPIFEELSPKEESHPDRNRDLNHDSANAADYPISHKKETQIQMQQESNHLSERFSI